MYVKKNVLFSSLAIALLALTHNAQAGMMHGSDKKHYKMGDYKVKTEREKEPLFYSTYHPSKQLDGDVPNYYVGSYVDVEVKKKKHYRRK